MSVTITDNSIQVKRTKDQLVEKALESIGILAENYAKKIITEEGRVDTGMMRNSIAHTVKDETAYIGSNLEYSVFHEIGTGIHLDPEFGTGRQTPWFYTDRNGEGHITHGMKGIHFLKRSVEEHTKEYERLTEQTLKGR